MRILQSSFIIYRVPSHQKLARRRSSQHGPYAICPIIANKLCNIAARLSALTCAKISCRISRRLQKFPTLLLGKFEKKYQASIYLERNVFVNFKPPTLKLYVKNVGKLIKLISPDIVWNYRSIKIVISP